MIKLIIDHRENELKEHFENKENVEFSNLDVGDIQFIYNEDIKDLKYSIKKYKKKNLNIESKIIETCLMFSFENVNKVNHIIKILTILITNKIIKVRSLKECIESIMLSESVINGNVRRERKFEASLLFSNLTVPISIYEKP